MKPLTLILLTALSLTAGLPASAMERTLAEWNFASAADTLGWTPAGGNIGLDKSEGALAIADGNNQAKIVSPLFDIKTTPWQRIEIEMKTDTGGRTLVYYSNTTDPPYGGFRPGVLASFQAIGDGQFHTYTIMPFWQGQPNMIHIRIDPPGKKNSVRSVRIIEPNSSQELGRHAWSFKEIGLVWNLAGIGSQMTSTTPGWQFSGGSDVVTYSPELNLDAVDYPWLTLRVASKAPHTILFRWAVAGRDGLQAVPIEVRGGGKVHSYAIDLRKVSEWSGKVIAVGVTPSNSQDSREIFMESLNLDETPVGPAEIRVTKFSLADPFTRVGGKAKVVVEAQNVGGSDADTVNASASVMLDAVPTVLPVKTLNKLGPGQTATFEWEINTKQEGTVAAACSVGARGLEAEQGQAILRFHPKLDKSAVNGQNYVPKPEIADTGDYLVGAYNFPGWRDYGAWSVLNTFPERRPILGYYNDGSPEVTDWQINWALGHGISYFIYDWYWNKGGRHLEEGLNDGFLKSRYQDRMKFCLLWANHNGPGSHSEEDMLKVTQYWIDNYFRRANYLKVNGNNVMVIFNPSGITEDMGRDGAKAAFEKMRKLCLSKGAGGLYLVACCGPVQDTVKDVVYEGYDAISGYNYPWAGAKGQNVAPYEWMVDDYVNVWNEIAAMAPSVPYIPLCEAGWDSRPWHGPNARVRTGKSAELWQKMLSNAKTYSDDPNRKHPEGKKLVFCEAWNEYGEGDYIEPNAGFGFDYLEAIRKVYAPGSKQPAVVVPKDLGMGPYDIAKPIPRTSWDFAKPEDHNWTSWCVTNLSFDGGVLRGEASNNDPILTAPGAEVDSKKYKTLEIRMKTDKPGQLQVFFTRPQEGMDEAKSFKVALNGDNQFHVYTIDLNANERWRGTISAIRLDPTDVSGAKFEIGYVKFR